MVGKVILLTGLIFTGLAYLGLGRWLLGSEFPGASSSEVLIPKSSIISDMSRKELEHKILSSTLRIEIKTWITYIEGQGYISYFSNGHGTVVDGSHLLTHNHFRMPLMELLEDETDGELATVKLFTANGELLWHGSLSATGVAVDDSETLLLEFRNREGQGLFNSLGIPSANFISGESARLRVGKTVAQVNWDEQRAFVQWSTIKAVKSDGGTRVVSVEECLIPGSSGGGVFVDGFHIGNNWFRSQGCIEHNSDGSTRYSTAALNSAEIVEKVRS